MDIFSRHTWLGWYGNGRLNTSPAPFTRTSHQPPVLACLHNIFFLSLGYCYQKLSFCIYV